MDSFRFLSLVYFFSFFRLFSCQCRSAFDFYLVLDKSGSIGTAWVNNSLFTSQFVALATKNPKSRMSIVLYDTTVNALLPPTNNKALISQAVETVKNQKAEGSTNTAGGLNQALKWLSDAQKTSSAIPIVVLITDGVANIPPTDGAPGGTTESRDASTDLKNKGAFVYTVGVGTGIKKSFLETICSFPSKQFLLMVPGESALVINNFAETIASKACIEINEITPGTICLNQTTAIQVRGRGLNISTDASEVRCVFNHQNVPAKIISDTLLQCIAPAFDRTQTVNVEIRVNKFSYTQTNVTVNVVPCGAVPTVIPIKPSSAVPTVIPIKPSSEDLSPGVIAAIVLLLLALLLCCLWWFLPLVLGITREKAQQEEDSPFVPLGDDPMLAGKNPDGTWAQIDTSKYIWAKDGGSARPLPVKWGNLGATSAGSHLESEMKISGSGIADGSDYNTTYESGSEDNSFCNSIYASCAACLSSLFLSCSACWDSLVDVYQSCANKRPHKGDY